MIGLSLIYARGDGVATDYQQAMRWYQRAASHHDPDAWVGVATLYEDGLGVTQSDAEAMRQYRHPAANGIAGPKAADRESGSWFIQASALGNAQAARVLQRRQQDCAAYDEGSAGL